MAGGWKGTRPGRPLLTDKRREDEIREGEYKEGKKHGLWISFFADGTKASEGSYRDGQKDGPWTLYHPNGHKKSDAMFADGKYTVLYTSYHQNGQRRWQRRYNEITGTSADGTKEGVWLDYEEDGENVRRRMTYRRGSKVRPDEFPPFENQ